ncbi:hypothetical protein NEOLEDRAFT_1174199 [Neolentinus lepideus HHB14362 ss-1]|uniref:Homeobox domain-containing protein n=1 Tax=Neolentinus lepideus HHB14362 ss-1 TaxID=1314782 RepID=A0A165W8H9_9AGAM|nr:hypothetical protein NEOLEDRAFT_1174199 [Neolentinus lepideus HHB14362 ss-1]
MNNPDVRTRLLQIESDFLSAIADNSDMEAFQATWEKLVEDVEEGTRASTLDTDTIALAHEVASRIHNISNSLLDLHEEGEKVTSAFMRDVKEILEHESSQDAAPSPLTVKYEEPFSSTSLKGRRNSFVFPCYKWLIHNVHNPYPGKAVKEIIAADTGASVTSIDAWFQSARRRIGWTNVSKRYFDSCRKSTVAAARRILCDGNDAMPEDAHLTHEFLEIKAKAQSLCSKMYKKSRLAGELDVAVKDMTAADWRQAEIKKQDEEAARQRRKELEKELRRLERAKQRLSQKLAKEFHHLVTPSPSRHSSRTPSLTHSRYSDSDDDEELAEPDGLAPYILATPSTPSTSLKRRNVSSDTDGENLGSSSQRPSKRTKISFDPDVSGAEVMPPSTSYCDPRTSPTPNTPTQIPPTPVDRTSRKRRLSESDTNNCAKRPRGSMPRPYAVSDPIPSPFHIDFDDLAADWDWQNVFDPAAVDLSIGGLEGCTDLDIQLFNSWPVVVDNEDSYAEPRFSPTESPTSDSIQQLDIPEFRAASPAQTCQELNSRVPDVPDRLEVSTLEVSDFFAEQSQREDKSAKLQTSSSASPTEWSHPHSLTLGTPPLLPGHDDNVRLTSLLDEGGHDSDAALDFSQILNESPCQEGSRTLLPSQLAYDCFKYGTVGESSPCLLEAQTETLRSLDQHTKLQQYFALRQAATLIEQELLMT